MKKSRAYLNVLKLRLNRAARREVVSNFPIEAYIEPTSFCNLRCPACPTGLRLGERPSASVNENVFKSAIDEIGDYVFLLWMYNWGEPLLHRQTPELIRYAKAKDLKVILSSNLSVKLSDDYIERLVGSGLDTLIVSLDGVTEESYGKYRRGGSLALVRGNLLRLRAAKSRLKSETPRLLWQFLVFRHNEHEIEQAAALHREWGADEIKFAPAEMPLAPYADGFEPSTLPQYNMYHDASAFAKETARQMAAARPCSWLYGTFVMNPNGKVSPCCGVSAEKNDFGEYAARGDFFKVWNSDRFREARRMFARLSGGVPGEEERREISRRIDGMAMGVNHSLDEGELICHKCPIPFRQGDADERILDIAYGLMHTLVHDPSPSQKLRSAVAYALMGAPFWRKLLGDAARKALRRP